MSKLILVRGLPGSGKSTYAMHKMRTDHGVIDQVTSTDNYFNRPDGYYDFNPRLLKQAHKWNQQLTKRVMQVGFGGDVYVANTFTTHWEMKSYLDMASELQHEVEVVHVQSGLTDQELADRNVHGVPVEAIAKMRVRWEPYEGEVIADGK